MQYRDKVFKESQHVRGIDLGRDRYKRNYWVLPHAGGVFIEGMESGEIKELVKVKVRNDRSEVKNLKIEVIDERSEKKGFEFLDEIEEKKAVKIWKNKSAKNCANKRVLVNGGKELKYECKDICELKDQDKKSHIVKVESMGSIKCEDVKVENCLKFDNDKDMICKKSSDEVHKVNGHNVTDIHIKTNELSEMVVNSVQLKQESLCNGDIRNIDQISLQHASVSGSQYQSNSSKETDTKSSDHETGTSHSSKNKTGTSYSSNYEADTSNSKSHKTGTGYSNYDADPNNLSSLETGSSKSKHVELKIPSVKSSAIEQEKLADVEKHSNIFLQIPQSTKLSDFCGMSIDACIKTEPATVAGDEHKSLSSLFLNTSFPNHVTKSTNHLASPTSPPPAHSKAQSSDRKRSFMSIDSILEKKTGSSQSNNSYPNSVLPVNPFVNQSVRSKSDNHSTDCRPWFSLLPRVPCDDMSLTRGQHTPLSSGIIMSPPFLSQLPFHPFSVQSPTFSSFQMGQLFNTSLDQSLTETSSAMSTVTTVTQSSDSSFKKPEPVSSSQNPDPEDVLKSLQGEAKPIPEGKYPTNVVNNNV